VFMSCLPQHIKNRAADKKQPMIACTSSATQAMHAFWQRVYC
jgi:hypothetical protein